jgi:dipeptidase
MDDTYSTVYTPMYCGITKVPSSFAVGNGSMMEFSETSAFWVFNQVSNFAYTRYKDMIPYIQQVQRELENKYIANTPAVDAAAMKLYKDDPAKAIEFLTDYSVSMGDATTTRWKQLYAFLFTRFMDGNIKTAVPGQQNPKVQQPGYDTEYYKYIIEKSGDKLRVAGSAGH